MLEKRETPGEVDVHQKGYPALPSAAADLTCSRRMGTAKLRVLKCQKVTTAAKA